VIGDVSGKGAEAAAFLALARYTIRASAMHQGCPAAVLSDLNEAVLRHGRGRDDGRFCTAVYARVDRDGNPPRRQGLRLARRAPRSPCFSAPTAR
jgi:sigma-B regulation protein RsbU (phosphoserine phosphatase)